MSPTRIQLRRGWRKPDNAVPAGSNKIDTATPTRGTNPVRSAFQRPAGAPARPNHGSPVGRCGGCATWWQGERTCHCAAPECHRTFSGVVAFDAHRFHGTCREPASIGMSLLSGRAYECWGHPGEAAP